MQKAMVLFLTRRGSRRRNIGLLCFQEKKQETGRYKNNQIENSHLHFRRRERGMNKFRLMRSLQKFVSIQSSFQNHFNHQRHLETRQTFKSLGQNSVDSWKQTFA